LEEPVRDYAGQAPTIDLPPLPAGSAHPGPEQLVQRAMRGDHRAWEALVDLYSGLIWAVTRQFRLCDADAADVTQTTWLRLLEHIDGLHDASRVGPWLATTARRECLRILAQRKRLVLTGDASEFERADRPDAEVDASLLAAERSSSVHEALSLLPERWRDIMTLLTVDPPMAYEQISATLDVPIGSIGPTRRRCLQRLHGLLEV
jgi:RNA polymerase sigma factor (sigma-70 family)